MLRIAAILALGYAALVVIVYLRQRSMIYFPGHGAVTDGLAAWRDGERALGCCREAANPRTIWLMMHGNAGQAADRGYVLPRMSELDSLYVLEYPGYGSRAGSPSRESINQAATEAYRLLRSQHPGVAVCLLGESIGSGPACALAAENPPPDKIVLVVPFDTLAKAASGHFPYLPVRFMLRDAWDNVDSLKHYSGPIEIFGAADDHILPIDHARALARQAPNARFTAIRGGHNDWAEDAQVKIER